VSCPYLELAAYICTTGEAAFRLLPFHSEFCRWRNSLAKAVFKQAWHCSFGFLEFSRFSDGLKLIALLNVSLSLSQDSGTKIRIISESTFIVS